MTRSRFEPNLFVHRLLRARDWQERREFLEVRNWWADGGLGVCCLVGIGGAGKTAIIDRFLQCLPDVLETNRAHPKDTSLPTPKGVFVFSFYNESNADVFFSDLSAWLIKHSRHKLNPHEDHSLTHHEMLQLLQHSGFLLVLDGLEMIQEDGSQMQCLGGIVDRRLSDLVERVADGLIPNLSLIVTTRFPIAPLEEHRPTFYTFIEVGRLSKTAAITLLQERGVTGSTVQLSRIVNECGRHALTVDLAGGYLTEFHCGDPGTILELHPTAEILQRISTEPNPRRRFVLKQEYRFARIAEKYGAAIAERDPATIALLQRVCLFRVAVTAKTMSTVFAGPDKKRISGEHLSALTEPEIYHRLEYLAELRILERAVQGEDSGLRQLEDLSNDVFTIHPAVREGFLAGLDDEEVRDGHAAAQGELESRLSGRAASELDPHTLDLLEEIIYHATEVMDFRAAWQIYQQRMGAYPRLGIELGEYHRGSRICRLFARNTSPRDLLLLEGYSNNAKASLANEWGNYLTRVGELQAAVLCYEISVTIRQLDRQESEHNLFVATRNLCSTLLQRGQILAAVNYCLEITRKCDTRARSVSANVSGINEVLAWGQILLGQVDAAATTLNEIRNQDDVARLFKDEPPLFGLAGRCLAELRLRLGNEEQARPQIEMMSVDTPASLNDALVLLLKAECCGMSSSYNDALSWANLAHDWGLRHDEKEVVCRAVLFLCRTRLAMNPELNEAGDVLRSLNEALHICQECGLGLLFVDLHVARARVHLHQLRPTEALADLSIGLVKGISRDAGIGQPDLFSAGHEDCGYAWPIPEGLQLKAEALLLKAAQLLGASTFRPRSRKIPAEVRDLIKQSKALLKKAMTLWKKLKDPESTQNCNFIHPDTRVEFNFRAAETFRISTDLSNGVLTRYFDQALPTGRFPSETVGVPQNLPETGMTNLAAPRVLISYTHDSASHSKSVLELANRLREDGVESQLDQYIQNPPEGWPMWMHREIESADFVLVVSTERYSRKATEQMRSGGRFESVLILQDLYDAGMSNNKFVPVVFDSSDAEHILKWIKPVNFYDMSNSAGYVELLRRLVGDPAVVPPPVGNVVKKGPILP